MKIAALFDIDNTIVDGYTQGILAGYLFKKGEISFFSYSSIGFWFIIYKMHLTNNIATIRDRSVSVVNGWEIARLGRLVDDCFNKQIRPRFFPQVLELVCQHIKKGDAVVLVSSSLDVIVNRIKEYLGLQYAICTHLETRDGKYTGKVKEPAIYGKNKASIVKQFAQDMGLDLSSSFAYSDHISDLPMLELVGHPCAINPGRQLGKICGQRKWRTIKV